MASSAVVNVNVVFHFLLFASRPRPPSSSEIDVVPTDMSSGQFVYSYFSYSMTRFSYSLHRFVLFSIFSILLPFLGLWGVSFGPMDMTSSKALLFLVSFLDSWGVSCLSCVKINNGTTCLYSRNINRTQTTLIEGNLYGFFLRH